MAIKLTEHAARLTGKCGFDDAEPLLEWLLQHPENKAVDLKDCMQLHTAVLQVLMALSPPIIGPPKGETLARWLPLHLTERTEKKKKRKKRKSRKKKKRKQSR